MKPGLLLVGDRSKAGEFDDIVGRSDDAGGRATAALVAGSLCALRIRSNSASMVPL